MQQADDFYAESAALAALLKPLHADDFARQTAFKSWSVDDVLGHLHIWNEAALWSLTDEDRFQAFFSELRSGFGKGRSMKEAERDYLPICGPELLELWQQGFAATANAFADADPKLRVKWAGPDMSARSSITARLMETWAHGQEVYDTLGVVRQNADRIRNIAVLGINTYGWTFKVRGEDAPQPMPYVVLTAPSGAEWGFGQPSDAERIEGKAEEFCQVVTQTRNIADTALRVTGPNAAAWMERAQCFAGAASPPPAPGTRFTGH